MSAAKPSSERLVLDYLAARALTRVKTARDIEIDCRLYWETRGIARSGSTYRRAFQRLLKAGAIRTDGDPLNDHGARVHVLTQRVTRADVYACAPAQHGG